MSDFRFSGTDSYVATEDLTTAVNAAVTLGRPILIKGLPHGPFDDVIGNIVDSLITQLGIPEPGNRVIFV